MSNDEQPATTEAPAPTIGRIVHYHVPSMVTPVRPAIVMAVREGVVDLNVFDLAAGATPRYNVAYGEGETPYWTWPERV